MCNQCLSPLLLWVQPCSWRGVLDTTLCDGVCQWLATGGWFSLGIPLSSTNKTDSRYNWNIVENCIKHHKSTINFTDVCIFFLQFFHFRLHYDMRHQYKYIQVVLVLFGIASVILFIQHHIELRDSNTIWTSSQVFYPANGKGKRTTKEEFNKYLINVRLSDDIPVNRDIPDSRPDR